MSDADVNSTTPLAWLCTPMTAVNMKKWFWMPCFCIHTRTIVGFSHDKDCRAGVLLDIPKWGITGEIK